MNQDQDELIYGLDTSTMKVVDPNKVFELMSYCGSTTNSFTSISSFTYNNIRNAINSQFSSPLQASLGSLQDYLVVSGTVDLPSGTVELSPFGSITSSMQPPLPNPGDFTLQLLDSGGNLISEVSFQPNEHDQAPPIGGTGEDPTFGTFIISIPHDPDIKQVIILHDGNPVATRSASPNPPTVQVIFPNGGEGLTENQVTLQWNGDDPDGDTLSYVVQYSKDNGATWETLAVDWPNETY